jgi:hypothetical protein
MASTSVCEVRSATVSGLLQRRAENPVTGRMFSRYTEPKSSLGELLVGAAAGLVFDAVASVKWAEPTSHYIALLVDVE